MGPRSHPKLQLIKDYNVRKKISIICYHFATRRPGFWATSRMSLDADRRDLDEHAALGLQIVLAAVFGAPPPGTTTSSREEQEDRTIADYG